MTDLGHTVFVPHGHAAWIYPVPAIADSATDDGSQILDEAALHHVVELIDEGEDG